MQIVHGAPGALEVMALDAAEVVACKRFRDEMERRLVEAVPVLAFGDGPGAIGYLIGAVLMGFGAVLAGGCTVGAGMTGGSIFSLTAWLTLIAIWLGAGLAWRINRSMGWPI